MTSVFKTHLEKLKSFTSPVDDGVNKLYFLEVEEKPRMVKVGDTTRDVVLRNQETMTNASLHRKKGTSPIWVIAKKWNGTVYRDKKFHSFLRKKGYKFDINNQDNDSEWVMDVTVEQLFKELEEFTGKPEYKTVTLKTAQHYLLDQLQASVNEGYRYINAGFCVRVGKTIISLTLASKNNWFPVYIGKNLTSQASANADNEKFGIVPDMATVSIHGNDYNLEDGDSAIVNRVITKIDASNKQGKQIIFFVDEVDDASHTKRSRAIIKPVIEHYKKQSKFACIVTMSGTRIYRGEKILNDLRDGAIKSLSLEYYEMQLLQPTTTCRRNFRHINYYTEKGNLVNISNAMKNKDHGHKSISTCVANLLGTNKFEFNINPEFPHWFIKFATVGKDNANKLCNYMNRNYNVIENREFFFAPINGDFTKAEEAQDYCKSIIEANPRKNCVFVSQGMATTSFSIETIGNSVVFTDNEITSDDIQALHRSATWSEGKDDCNMIVVTTNDSTEISFDDIFEDELKIANTRQEKEEIYRVLLDCNSMIHFHEKSGFSPVRITHENTDKFIDKKQQAMTKIASFINALIDLDEDIQDNIYQNITGKKGTSKNSIGAKGDKFDPFGNNDNKNSTHPPKSSDMLSQNRKEQILRAFVENAIIVPAVAVEQGTTIREFKFWDEIGVSKELFLEVYNASWQFRDRIDTIYNLCSDDQNYLIENYINKLSV